MANIRSPGDCSQSLRKASIGSIRAARRAGKNPKTSPINALVPMAIALAYGVLCASTVTLFLVPCGYVILEDVIRIVKRDGAARQVGATDRRNVQSPTHPVRSET